MGGARLDLVSKLNNLSTTDLMVGLASGLAVQQCVKSEVKAGREMAPLVEDGSLGRAPAATTLLHDSVRMVARLRILS